MCIRDRLSIIPGSIYAGRHADTLNPKIVRIFFKPDYIPVSYTHLDVYKRQLITVTIRVPSFLLSLSDIRLDTIVPPDMAMDTMPIYDIGTPSSRCKMCIRDSYKSAYMRNLLFCYDLFNDPEYAVDNWLMGYVYHERVASEKTQSL